MENYNIEKIERAINNIDVASAWVDDVRGEFFNDTAIEFQKIINLLQAVNKKLEEIMSL